MPPLTAHFDRAEFDRPESFPDAYAANLPVLAALLERVRDAVGSAFTLTDVYRSPAHNAAVGGVCDSQHLHGEAGDGVFEGVPIRYVGARLLAARGTLGPFGQIIIYADKGHVHVSIPRVGIGAAGDRRQMLMHTTQPDGSPCYTPLTDATQLPLYADSQLPPKS